MTSFRDTERRNWDLAEIVEIAEMDKGHRAPWRTSMAVQIIETAPLPSAVKKCSDKRV